MSLPDAFMLGSTIDDIETLEDLGITNSGEPYDPQASYRPFSVVDKLGDLSIEGNGFPVATWHWAALAPGHADILYEFLNGDISAPVVFRTLLNRLNMAQDNQQFATFSGVMEWMEGEENIDALHARDVTITFNGLILIPDYP